MKFLVAASALTATALASFHTIQDLSMLEANTITCQMKANPGDRATFNQMCINNKGGLGCVVSNKPWEGSKFNGCQFCEFGPFATIPCLGAGDFGAGDFDMMPVSPFVEGQWQLPAVLNRKPTSGMTPMKKLQSKIQQQQPMSDLAAAKIHIEAEELSDDVQRAALAEKSIQEDQARMIANQMKQEQQEQDQQQQVKEDFKRAALVAVTAPQKSYQPMIQQQQQQERTALVDDMKHYGLGSIAASKIQDTFQRAALVDSVQKNYRQTNVEVQQQQQQQLERAALVDSMARGSHYAALSDLAASKIQQQQQQEEFQRAALVDNVKKINNLQIQQQQQQQQQLERAALVDSMARASHYSALSDLAASKIQQQQQQEEFQRAALVDSVQKINTLQTNAKIQQQQQLERAALVDHMKQASHYSALGMAASKIQQQQQIQDAFQRAALVDSVQKNYRQTNVDVHQQQQQQLERAALVDSMAQGSHYSALSDLAASKILQQQQMISTLQTNAKLQQEQQLERAALFEQRAHFAHNIQKAQQRQKMIGIDNIAARVAFQDAKFGQ